MERSARYRWALVWALIIGVAMGTLAVRGALSGLEWRAYDLQLAAHVSQVPQRDIVIVIIDDRCLEPDRLGPWPWPMRYHLQLVRRLAAAHPRAIVFDLLFFGQDQAQSAQFAQALREAGNVYLAAAFLEGAQRPHIGRYGVAMGELRAPPAQVVSAAAGMGAVNVFPERDGVVRSAPLVMDHAGSPFPSLALQVAAGLGGRGYQVRRRRAIELRLNGSLIPVNSAGEMLISYAGRYKVFPWVRYDQVLEGKIPLDRFRDRIVFVGFSATGLSDTRPTPLSPACPGVEINANTLHAILRGDFIRPLGGLGNGLVVLGVALVLGLALPRLRPVVALTASMGAALLIVAASIYLFQKAGLWIGVVTPALASVMVGLVVAAAGYRATDRDMVRLESSLGVLALATRMIAASTARKAVLAAIREEITQLARARQTDLYLVDEDAAELVLVGSERQARLPLAGGALGQVVSEGVPLAADAMWDGELARQVGRAADFMVGPVALIPLRRQQQVVGVVQVVREPGAEPFGERELELLNALSQEAAVALENVELYEKLEGKVELANRELILEKDRIEALLENMADGVIMTDTECRVRYVNPAAQRMFNVGAREVEGQPVSQRFGVGRLPDVIARACQVAGELVSQQVVVEQPKRLVLTAAAALIADERGQPVGVVTVLSDVTLLQEMSDMKTEFVSLVSHELRTPLTSIQGFAQTLRSDAEGHFDAETREEFLGIIEGECRRLLSMINELLDASRIEAGRALAMNWTQVNLAEMVERVVKLQATQAHQHQFAVELPPDLPSIEADADRIEQVLTNVVSNAIKYSPEGGQVRITGRRQDGEVVVAVEDQGLGMTEAQTAQLFQRYHRVESDASKRIRGTGLGLYLTKGLIEAHGGRIWAESEGPGKGSRFSFALPVKRVVKGPEAASRPAGVS